MRELRRKERGMNMEDARAVLGSCRHAVLAMVGEDGLPYAVPVSPVLDGDTLYFHSARDGEKVDALRVHPEVCVTAVGEHHTVEERYTEAYRSAIARGRAEQVEGEEKRLALRLLAERYCPTAAERWSEEAELYDGAVLVYAIRLRQICGKQNPG